MTGRHWVDSGRGPTPRNYQNLDNLDVPWEFVVELRGFEPLTP